MYFCDSLAATSRGMRLRVSNGQPLLAPGWVTIRVRSSKNLETHTRVCLPTVTTATTPYHSTIPTLPTIVHNPRHQLMAIVAGRAYIKKKNKYFSCQKFIMGVL